MNKPLRLALDVLAEVERGEVGPSLQRRAGEARALLQRRKRPTKTMPESVKVKEKVSAERESAEGRRQPSIKRCSWNLSQCEREARWRDRFRLGFM